MIKQKNSDMNQENVMTHISPNSAGEYLAPKVKVVEVKARRIICLSGDPENIYGGYTNSEQEGS